MIYVEHNSTNPYINFAIEYYLMTEANIGEDTLFMFWQTDPTVMLGYYQNIYEEINLPYVRESAINIVRRITGGGTIYTDMGGWQFSFITSNSNRNIDFHRFTEPIVQAIRGIGVEATFNSRNDLVIDGKKFSGNAQCNVGGYTLHHGSILFDTDIEKMVKSLSISDDKIVSKGIKSVRERVANIRDYLKKDMDAYEFRDIMLERLIGANDSIYRLSEKDLSRINIIAQERYNNWETIYGRSPKFNIEKKTRVAGGKVVFRLSVVRGVIESVSIGGDFFSDRDITEVERALVGIKYDIDSITDKIRQIDAEEYFHMVSNEELIDCIV